MPTKRKKELRLSKTVIEIIKKGLVNGKTGRQIQGQIRRELKEKVTLKVIESFKRAKPIPSDAKRIFPYKQSGAEIVGEFLKGAKEGQDVSHLQAALEHAVYVDSLRRYAMQEEGLESLDIKDVIKITNDYRKLNISSLRAVKGEPSSEKLSSALALKLIELVENELSTSETLALEFKSKKQSIVKKFKGLIDEKELPEIEFMQELHKKYLMEKEGS